MNRVRALLGASTLLRHLLLALLAGFALYLLSLELDPFRNFQLATVAAYLCATAGLTVLTGLSGQLSLGHGALMAVGAYTVALCQNALAEHDVTGNGVLPLSLLAGVLVTMAAGAVIGLAAARLRGPYLAGVTLAVAVAVPAATVTFDELFNSEQGLGVYVEPPPLSLGPYFPNERWQAWIALLGALLTMLLLANLTRGRFGRTLRAVRDDEVAARLSGINVARAQVLAFVVSAAGAGLGGGLLAVLAQSVSPGAFSLTLSLFLLMAVVIGGLGSLSGAVWGALLLVALPDLAHEVSSGLVASSPGAAQRLEGNLPLLVFGLTLIVVMIAMPGGVQSLLRRLTGWARRRLPSR
ncbi:branched-chain amino acid ABC transporter permease [Catellatospora tritici]|uniref:branched-chain amino acid ABC transporter permease n=1 Tax=Catellatospora tritici TaxID=2851566 RepID=UPI001C2D41CB|nr:branched-chain amino acid ABC transporter permease [Catellatospora tritici]MBV1855017.1 branched-chain amino acid ABC transporter permease [Catellatospora tritici]